MNFDKITQKSTDFISKAKGEVTLFEAMALNYRAFVTKIEKSDFKNSSTRYMSELELLQKLKKHAQEGGLLDEVENIDKKIVATEQILKENFGIVFRK